MSSAPSLFATLPAPAAATPAAATPLPSRPAGSLVELLYDGFCLLALLQSGRLPQDLDAFSRTIQTFLEDFERAARKAHFAGDDIFDARYAFCAAIDEAVLRAGPTQREAWERRPLQLLLFGEQLAGEHFFDRLEAARNGGASRLAALDVFHLCLLSGFQGRYLLEGPEQRNYLIARLGEQIAHLKGRPAPFAPHWEAPDRIANAIRRELPLWVVAAVLALFGLLAYIGLEWQAQRSVHDTLGRYDHLVQLAPRPPSLTITLP